jgi:hypothetical protein
MGIFARSNADSQDMRSATWREAVDQWPRTRRLANGAIDFDFYRRKARAQRVAAIGDFFTLKRRDGLGVTVTVLARLRAAWKS